MNFARKYKFIEVLAKFKNNENWENLLIAMLIYI